jgi:hypothetical protein
LADGEKVSSRERPLNTNSIQALTDLSQPVDPNVFISITEISKTERLSIGDKMEAIVVRTDELEGLKLVKHHHKDSYYYKVEWSDNKFSILIPCSDHML